MTEAAGSMACVACGRTGGKMIATDLTGDRVVHVEQASCDGRPWVEPAPAKVIRPSQLFGLSDHDLAIVREQAKGIQDVYQYLLGHWDKERQAIRLERACWLLQSRRRAARQTGE